MTRGRRIQALERRLGHLRERLNTQARTSASTYAAAEASSLEWVLEREAHLADLERRLVNNPEAAMDLWWTVTGDDWAVPNDLPARFLKAALEATR